MRADIDRLWNPDWNLVPNSTAERSQLGFRFVAKDCLAMAVEHEENERQRSEETISGQRPSSDAGNCP